MIASPLIAHRGASLLAPENTLGAMTKTRDIGTPWVEIDVNRLGDGTLVMFHDDQLGRLTSARGRLCDQRWEDVQSLDIGSHFSADYSGERMARLSQALDHIQALDLGLNLEIKVYPEFTPEQIVFDTIKALDTQWHNFGKLLISSFNTEVLDLLHHWRPSWQCGHLWERIPNDWARRADALNLVSVHCDHRFLTPELARSIRASGLDLYCYTVNDRERAAQLMDLGVDGIITDDPVLLGSTR
ncbi:glycerophosphodiester phosphodiesterase family protein [Saccharospirillum impatiens]|uniref:glycerophosphodiester phosphodiesterase family protein n=1 Tax=Saccharospirillum impatiens TaxID=169438 RepID=UPI000409A235|nr:glycerophosphodiester phosphodiesterase family protein [Saccharospirillum impatiens]